MASQDETQPASPQDPCSAGSLSQVYKALVLNAEGALTKAASAEGVSPGVNYAPTEMALEMRLTARHISMGTDAKSGDQRKVWGLRLTQSMGTDAKSKSRP